MKIEERSEGPAVVVSPAGRLDAVGAPDLEARLAAVAKAGPGRLVVDCREVAYISSAGLRALLLGARACFQTGCEFSVAGLRPECRSILDATGLLMILDCPETVEDALAAPAAESPREAEGARGFVIAERELGRTVLLMLDGRLEGKNASILTERIFAAVGRGSARVVLDCERMDYADSSGLRALLVSAKLCREKGGRLVLAALLPECQTIIDKGGFTSIIDYFETREAALTALA